MRRRKTVSPRTIETVCLRIDPTPHSPDPDSASTTIPQLAPTSGSLPLVHLSLLSEVPRTVDGGKLGTLMCLPESPDPSVSGTISSVPRPRPVISPPEPHSGLPTAGPRRPVRHSPTVRRTSLGRTTSPCRGSPVGRVSLPRASRRTWISRPGSPVLISPPLRGGCVGGGQTTTWTWDVECTVSGHWYVGGVPAPGQSRREDLGVSTPTVSTRTFSHPSSSLPTLGRVVGGLRKGVTIRSVSSTDSGFRSLEDEQDPVTYGPYRRLRGGWADRVDESTRSTVPLPDWGSGQERRSQLCLSGVD